MTIACSLAVLGYKGIFCRADILQIAVSIHWEEFLLAEF